MNSLCERCIFSDGRCGTFNASAPVKIYSCTKYVEQTRANIGLNDIKK